MSISLHSIDCPYLTIDYLNHLHEKYSIHTTNDFLLWLTKSTENIDDLSLKTIECIQSCILAHTAQIHYRLTTKSDSYRLNYNQFDNEKLLQTSRHLIFIYGYFNQKQWNEFFNFFLLRLFLINDSIKIKYLNTNISLFDLHYFYNYYCSLNEKLIFQRNNFFEESFYFQTCFTLEAFEDQLNFLENNHESIQILIIDDFFALIRPYLNLDRRIRNKILQLTYRLNRLAQKQSILIINGLISPMTKRKKNFEESFSLTNDLRFDTFHADKYILFQSLTMIEKDLFIQILNEKTKDKQAIQFKLNLDEWIEVSKFTIK